MSSVGRFDRLCFAETTVAIIIVVMIAGAGSGRLMIRCLDFLRTAAPERWDPRARHVAIGR